MKKSGLLLSDDCQDEGIRNPLNRFNDRSSHAFNAHKKTRHYGRRLLLGLSSFEGEDFPAPPIDDAVLDYFAFRFQATRAATAAATLSRANSDGSGTIPPGTSLANAAAGARNNTAARMMIEHFIWLTFERL